MTKLKYFCLSLLFILSVNSLSTAQVSNRIPELVKKIEPLTVLIMTYDNQGKNYTRGTGFFINKIGHIVTNRHILEGSNTAKIKTADGKVYKVNQVLAEGLKYDLIKLSIDIPAKKEILPLTINKIPVKVGEQILVVGNPLGLERTVSDGIVSAIRIMPGYGKVIQITAPVSKGSSGSPVVNMKGELIGVATFKMVEGQNLNFVIPSNRLENFKQIRETISEWELTRIDRFIDESLNIIKESNKFNIDSVCKEVRKWDTGVINRKYYLINDILIKGAEAYRKIGIKYKVIDTLSSSLQIANETGTSLHGEKYFSDIAGVYARMGMYEDALNLIEKINNQQEKINGLIDIAVAYANDDNSNKSLETFSKAAQIVATTEDRSLLNMSLSDIAVGLYKSGQKDMAVEILDEEFQHLKAQEMDSMGMFNLILIAGRYTEIGNYKKASELLSQLLNKGFQRLKIQETDWLEMINLILIAMNYTEIGNYEKASELLSQLLNLAEEVGSHHKNRSQRWHRKAEVLKGILWGFVENNEFSEALLINEKIKNLTEKEYGIEDTTSGPRKNRILLRKAYYYAMNGNIIKALNVIKNFMDDDILIADALIDVINSFLETEQNLDKKAGELLDKIVQEIK